MRFRFITGDYDDRGLYWLCRNEKGEKVRVYIHGFLPYFYVKEDLPIPPEVSPVKVEYGFRRVIDGVRMKKIVVSHPSLVKWAREKFSPEDCGEDDIRFVTRSLIDCGVKSGFETIPIQAQYGLVVNPKSIRSTDCDDIPLRVGYIDIEVLTSGRFPNATRPHDKIICLTFCQNGMYHTVLLDEEKRCEKREANWVIHHVTSEEEVITRLEGMLSAFGTDILTSWGNFDWEYLEARAKYLGLKWKPDCIPLNLVRFYRQLERGSARLKTVVKKEGLVKNIESETFHSEWYGRDNEKLIRYNKSDVEYLIKVDEEFKLSDFAIALKEFAGLPDFELFASQVVESLILRKYYGSGWVFPSRRGREDKSEMYSGGYLETCKAGFYENVGVFDMSSYYLSIIISKRLTFELDGGRRLPELVEEALSLKKQIDSQMKSCDPNSSEYRILESKKQAVKSFLLALYGVLGDSSSRFFKVEMASTVTEIGRKGIQFIRDVSPYPVLYIHTDSLFIQAPFEKCQELEAYLNKKLEEFSRENNLDPPLTLKFERFYDTILFTGVKARHAGHVIWEGKPVDYLRVAGYEMVRGDSSELTREVQENVLDLILKRRWDEVIPYLRKVVSEIQTYPIEKIAIPKTLQQETYKTKPNFVRGAEYAIKYLGEDIRAGDTIHFIPVKRVPKNLPSTDVVSVLDISKLKDFEPDYQELIEKTVKAKVEDFLGAIGRSWEEVEGQTTLRGWM
jgi:DNA polymerase I